MAIFRVEKNNNYTTISNYHLRDKNISLKAKGLLSFMLSLPDDWDYSLNGLVSVLNEGETAIDSALKELKKNGYLRIDKIKGKKGKFKYIYNIFEEPTIEKMEISKNKKADKKDLEVESLDIKKSEAEKPGVEKPGVENPGVEVPGVEVPGLENPTQINTNNKILNNKKRKIKKKNKKEKETDIDKIIKDKITDEDVKQAFYDFLKMRKSIKKPVTTRAVKILIKRLFTLSTKKEEQILILENSIVNSWQGIFPLKDEQLKEIETQEKEYKIVNMTEEEYYKKNGGKKNYG